MTKNPHAHSRENGNPVDNKTPYKECLLTGFPLSWEWGRGEYMANGEQPVWFWLGQVGN